MDNNNAIRNIEVEVTLKGGQGHACILPSNSPLLHELYVALAHGDRPDPPQPGILLQLPLQGGTAAVSFLSTSLVSVTTKPAVLIQPQLSAAASQNSPVALKPPAYFRIDDFLTPDENSQLLEYALANEENFEGSSVITDKQRRSNPQFRKSRVLFSIHKMKWRQVFINRIKLHLPQIASALGEENFQFDDNEVQLTASNDGDFFKRHADSDRNSAEVSGRIITFVYYFHQTPKPYAGGDLLLYSEDAGRPAYDSGSNVIAIAPQNNCLVAFESHLWHEVDMVRCPSGKFADSRFTINGWLRREIS